MNTTHVGSGPASPDVGRRRFTVRRTRIGGWWVALVASAFALLLFMIFVLQNLQIARVSFLGAQGNLPMGIAMLFAAIGGVLIVAIPGTGRIIQLEPVLDLAFDRRAASRRPLARPRAKPIPIE